MPILSRSLGVLELFSSSPFESLWLLLTRSSLPLTIWSEWTQAWCPLWAKLSYWVSLATAQALQPRRLTFPTISSEWTWFGHSALTFMQIFRLSLKKERSMLFCTLCIYWILFHSVTVIHSFCVAIIQLSNVRFFRSTISSLIAVSTFYQILFIAHILTLEIYSRYFDPATKNPKTR
jgi:FlaA1/EpsC-like NDP-sugar epimerase